MLRVDACKAIHNMHLLADSGSISAMVLTQLQKYAEQKLKYSMTTSVNIVVATCSSEQSALGHKTRAAA